MSLAEGGAIVTEISVTVSVTLIPIYLRFYKLMRTYGKNKKQISENQGI